MLAHRTVLLAAAFAATLAPEAVSGGGSSTWYVDVEGTAPGNGTPADPYTSVQYAIDRATTLGGDTLLVSPGTYAETVDLRGKELKIRSTAGAAATRLDAGGTGSVVTLASGEGPGTLLEGFTLGGGSGTDVGGGEAAGGGVFCRAAAGTLQNCRIEGNDVFQGRGHGVYVEQANLTLEGCRVADNGDPLREGAGEFGGGLFALDAALSLVSTDVVHNFAGQGAGIEARGGVLRVEAGHIDNNRAGCEIGGGGGIRLSDGAHALISRTIVSGNSATLDSRDGGGLALEGARALVVDAVFSSNRADEGGAVHVLSGELVVERCTLTDNLATDDLGAPDTSGDGGALYVVAGGQATVRHCVFGGNTAAGSFPFLDLGRGGGVYGPARIERSTFVGNEAAEEGGAAFGAELSSSIAWNDVPDRLAGGSSASYSLVQGGWPGTDNFDVDPMFWEPLTRDYHLRPGSPCIDTGDPALPPDSDGSIADVGAFPFDPSYCPAPRSYCEGKVNSQGCVATISTAGEATLSGADDFHVTADDVLNGKLGVLIWGFEPDARPGFGATICVGTRIRRSSPLYSGGNSGAADCSGELDFHWSQAYMQARNVVAYSTIYAQFWYRDPRFPAPNGVGLTDAVAFTVCP